MVWENVPGAFSSNKGEDFRAVLEETARIADETVAIPGPPKGKWNTVGAIMGNGWSIAWRVLDAQYWGVPQRRRRIFLVADFGGHTAPEILFKRKGLSRHLAEGGETRKRVTANAERSVRTASGFCTEHSADSRGIGYQEECSPTLRAGVTPAIAIENHPADSRVKLDESGTVQTLTTRMGTGGGNVPMLAVPDKAYSIQGSMIGRADKNGPQGNGINEDVSFTLNTTDRHAVAFACNQRDEVRDMKDKSGALDLNGGSPACNQGGMVIVQCVEPGALSRGQGERVWDKCPTLRAKMGDNQPCVVFNEETITSKTNASNPKPGDPCHTLGATGAGRTIVLNDQGGSQMDVSENVTGTLRAEMHGNIPAVTTYQKVTGPLMANSHPGSYTGQDAHSDMLVSQSYSVRRLTPLECERLQGFPDGWTYIPGQTEATQEELEFWREVWLTWDKLQAEEPEEVKPRNDKRLLKWLKNPVSDSAQYKALGNSVAVPCPEYVLEGIKEVLEGMKC
jgi:DNA (cytosine-5)-methyltransferase 1